jgi:hypothetical protein
VESRERRAGGSLALVAALAMGLVVLLATGGFAAGALKEKSRTFTVSSGAAGEGTAKCKKGQEAVAGGFFGPADFVADPHLVVPFDSSRAGKRKWRYRAFSLSVGDDQASTYAYCDPDKPRLKAKSATTTTDDTAVSVTARCPRGNEAVSGGFSTDSVDEFVWVVASKRIGKRKWQSEFVNPTDDPIGFTSFAYCDKSEPRLKQRSEAITVESPNTASVTAKCRRGRSLFSGGFDGGFSEADSVFPFVNGSRRSGRRGWEVTAALGMSNPAEITAYAYCDKKKKK